MLLFVPAAAKYASLVSSVCILRPFLKRLRQKMGLQAPGWQPVVCVNISSAIQGNQEVANLLNLTQDAITIQKVSDDAHVLKSLFKLHLRVLAGNGIKHRVIYQSSLLACVQF